MQFTMCLKVQAAASTDMVLVLELSTIHFVPMFPSLGARMHCLWCLCVFDAYKSPCLETCMFNLLPTAAHVAGALYGK